jgi:uncharacterized protein (TIGR00730 family)
VGELLGRGGHRLVYGGGGSGLMGQVAWSAYEHGAAILGVIPRFLQEQERALEAPPQTVRTTETMCERKDLMIAAADAFLALPGGFGTVDEILDVISLSYLKVHDKPLVLLQTNREWEHFEALLKGIVGHGYADPLAEAASRTVDNARAAFDVLTTALPVPGAVR